MPPNGSSPNDRIKSIGDGIAKITVLMAAIGTYPCQHADAVFPRKRHKCIRAKKIKNSVPVLADPILF